MIIFIEIPTSEVWFVLRDSTLHASFIHLGHYKAFRFRHSLVALIFFWKSGSRRNRPSETSWKAKKKKKPANYYILIRGGGGGGTVASSFFLILILHVIFYTADLTI